MSPIQVETGRPEGKLRGKLYYNGNPQIFLGGDKK